MVEDKTVKKTLSLGYNVDVAKIVEQKEKKSKGSVIEIKGTPVVKAKVSKPLEDTSALTTSTTERKADSTNSNLTQEEITNRNKVLGGMEQSKSTQFVSGVSRLEVVKKESLLSVAEDAIAEDTTTTNTNTNTNTNTTTTANAKPIAVEGSKLIKTSLQKVVRPSVTNSKPIKGKVDEEKEAEVKNKKAASAEQLKKPIIVNWRNLDVSVLQKNDEEEEDEEEAVVEEVVEVEAKFVRRPIFVKRKKKFKPQPDKKYLSIEIKEEISVTELANVLQEKVRNVIRSLQSIDIVATEDTVLDVTTAELIANELGHSAVVIKPVSLDTVLNKFDDKTEDLVKRPPVVTIMGHVDHGKTSLLDALRKTNVVSGEAGGITQHIGAYQITTPTGELITFLDTPGHEAFSAIRSRGSKVTDIILLVVAADDGLKPQTLEAIEHAQKANVPIIVVINKIDKIDKTDKNVIKIKTDLLRYNVVVEEMGGDVLVVEVSAKEKIGLDTLLETILLQAEVLSLKTSYTGRAKGTIIEVKVEKGLGVLATILLERGTLSLSDHFVCGTKIGRVKMIVDDKGNKLKSSPPYLPVEISGFNDIINAGDAFIVVTSESEANQLAESRAKLLSKTANEPVKFNLQNLLSQNVDQSQTLSVIIKTDTQGSLEAIASSLDKIEHAEIKVKMVISGVGEITESDVSFAKTIKALIFGFNARANPKARDLAKKDNIELRYHSIIYKLIDDIKMIMSGMLDPEIVENIIGYATVKQVFNITKTGNIAGCVVTEGVIKKSAYVRLLRNNVVLYNDVLSQLKHFKEEAKEVKSGTECGIALSKHGDIIAGDVIECYEKTSNKKVVL